MAKYRITSETTNKCSTNRTEFYVEHKRWFGWCKIRKREDVNTILLRFNTYEEAEAYMIKNYFGHGYYYKPYPNEYHYSSYTYYV